MILIKKNLIIELENKQKVVEWENRNNKKFNQVKNRIQLFKFKFKIIKKISRKSNKFKTNNKFNKKLIKEANQIQYQKINSKINKN
jgi:hypothetical protein